MKPKCPRCGNNLAKTIRKKDQFWTCHNQQCPERFNRGKGPKFNARGEYINAWDKPAFRKLLAKSMKPTLRAYKETPQPTRVIKKRTTRTTRGPPPTCIIRAIEEEFPKYAVQEAKAMAAKLLPTIPRLNLNKWERETMTEAACLYLIGRRDGRPVPRHIIIETLEELHLGRAWPGFTRRCFWKLVKHINKNRYQTVDGVTPELILERYASQLQIPYETVVKAKQIASKIRRGKPNVAAGAAILAACERDGLKISQTDIAQACRCTETAIRKRVHQTQELDRGPRFKVAWKDLSEMEWLATHQAEVQQYRNQWVAIEDDKIIAHGASEVEVDKQAKQRGIATPFVVYIPGKDQMPFIGETLICQGDRWKNP